MQVHCGPTQRDDGGLHWVKKWNRGNEQFFLRGEMEQRERFRKTQERSYENLEGSIFQRRPLMCKEQHGQRKVLRYRTSPWISQEQEKSNRGNWKHSRHRSEWKKEHSWSLMQKQPAAEGLPQRETHREPCRELVQAVGMAPLLGLWAHVSVVHIQGSLRALRKKIPSVLVP